MTYFVNNNESNYNEISGAIFMYIVEKLFDLKIPVSIECQPSPYQSIKISSNLRTKIIHIAEIERPDVIQFDVWTEQLVTTLSEESHQFLEKSYDISSPGFPDNLVVDICNYMSH